MTSTFFLSSSAPSACHRPPASSPLSLHLPLPRALASSQSSSSPILLLSADPADCDLILISDDEADDGDDDVDLLQADQQPQAPSPTREAVDVSDLPSPSSASDSRTDTEDEGEGEVEVEAVGEASTQENRDLQEEDFHASQEIIEAEQKQQQDISTDSTTTAESAVAAEVKEDEEESGMEGEGSSSAPSSDAVGLKRDHSAVLPNAGNDEQPPPPPKRQKVQQPHCAALPAPTAPPAVIVLNHDDASPNAVEALRSVAVIEQSLLLELHARAAPIDAPSEEIDSPPSTALLLTLQPSVSRADHAAATAALSSKPTSLPAAADTSAPWPTSSTFPTGSMTVASASPSSSSTPRRAPVSLPSLLPFAIFRPAHSPQLNVVLSTTPYRTVFSASPRPARRPFHRRLDKREVKKLSEVELQVRLEEIEEEVTALDEAMEKDDRAGVDVMRGYEARQEWLFEEEETIEDELKHRKDEERKVERREEREWQRYNGPEEEEDEEEEKDCEKGEGEEGEEEGEDDEGDDSGDSDDSEDSGDVDMASEDEMAAPGDAAEPMNPFSTDARAPDAARYFGVLEEMSAIYRVDEAEFKRVTAEAARSSRFTSKQLFAFSTTQVERADAHSERKAAPPPDEEKRPPSAPAAAAAPTPEGVSFSNAKMLSSPSPSALSSPPAASRVASPLRSSPASPPAATLPITAFFPPAPAVRRKIPPTLFSSFTTGKGGTSAASQPFPRPSASSSTSSLQSSSSSSSLSSKPSCVRDDRCGERSSPLPATDDICSVIDLTED